jgi:hypothetical protein
MVKMVGKILNRYDITRNTKLTAEEFLSGQIDKGVSTTTKDEPGIIIERLSSIYSSDRINVYGGLSDCGSWYGDTISIKILNPSGKQVYSEPMSLYGTYCSFDVKISVNEHDLVQGTWKVIAEYNGNQKQSSFDIFSFQIPDSKDEPRNDVKQEETSETKPDVAEMQALLDKALAEKEAANKAAAEKWEREQSEAEKRAMEEKAAEIDARLAVLELAEKQAEETRLAEEAAAQQGGGCLIATAAFGSEMAPQIQFLRELRDNTVMSTESGTTFMTGFNQFYYSFSPQIADYERENPVFKEAVKVTLTPLLTSLTLLNYVEIDSEEEMLGYGIGIILLNVGMYFVAPAVLIISLKKKLQK